MLTIREYCGLAHERQVVRVEGLPADSSGWMRARETGELFAVQGCWVEVALEPFQTLTLEPAPDAADDFPNVTVVDSVISNGVISLDVPMGEGAELSSGPVRRMRAGEGPWRGRTFFDTRRAVRHWRGAMIERGPVRAIYKLRVDFEPEGFYEATITVDRGQTMAVIEEEFQAGSGDQVVWDFAGADLPHEMYLLNTDADYETRALHHYLDQRHTRLACWTQQSQQYDFSDGYGIRLDNNDVVAFIALEGGTWRGAKLNFLEAWSRRWLPNDPASRRDVAWEAKADAQPNPDRIPARGETLTEPHFNVEGWIGEGRRKWALVLTTKDWIEPRDLSGPSLNHFDDKPCRDQYRARQSMLRRIHTQRGIMPLEKMLAMDFEWPEETAHSTFAYPNDLLVEQLRGRNALLDDPAKAARDLLDCLEARVYGFWEGSGSAYTNPVVSRRVAPEMFRYEWLASQGLIKGEEKKLARALFAFLMYLFGSDNYYAGDASMLPVGSPDSLDPTLAGMANQNFYTDVINIPGTGAQIFANHPHAAEWRAFFIERWHRQLEYHMYPESGVWEESHTYYHHVLHTILPTFLRRRADGVDDEFAMPLFQTLVGSELKQITPRDAFFDDCRHVVIFGDHDINVELYRYLWREFAEAFAPHNQQLAEELAWLYAEMGGRDRLSVATRAPVLRNEHVQGLGVMFRGVDATGQESLLALRSGGAWGHHHNDDGSIQFYAQGRAMIVDSAFGNGQASGKKFTSTGHSRWTLKNHDPMNHFWRFTRGWVKAAELDGPFAYATSYSPAILVRSSMLPAVPLRGRIDHYRTVVQITPAAYLVIDAARTDEEQSVIFHVPLDGGDGPLHIENLTGNTPPVTGTDSPSNPAMDRYTTRSLEYPVTQGAHAAFLIASQKERPIVLPAESACTLRGENFDVTVEFGDGQPTHVQVRDNRSGAARIVCFLY